MRIPRTRPRLWWTPERLKQARAWHGEHGLDLRDDDWENLALHHVITGDKRSARMAIEWLKGLSLDVSRTASNDARWAGEMAAFVFDWCSDQMTESERRAILDRWIGYLETLDAKDWGGVKMAGSNYFWGYLRNNLLWGIAGYHETPKAHALLERTFNVRWKAFQEYATQGAAAGGVPPEGTQYGRYMLSYPVSAFTTAALLGRDLWQEAPFFQEAVYWLIHATPPAKTVNARAGRAFFQAFPFNDDEFFHDAGKFASSSELGAFLSGVMSAWPGKPIASYAQTYLDLVRPPIPNYIAAVHRAAPPRRFDSLPLDHYAPGMGYLYARSRWGPEGTVINLQLGMSQATGHSHLDAGTFQIWRKGRWLSRESAGYAEGVRGWKGEGQYDVRDSAAHNSVLFHGRGAANSYHLGPPKVLRVESRKTHAYAAVDLTPVYLSNSEHVERNVNPYVKSIVREFLFIRQLEALLVLDRVESAGGKMPAADVEKTFVVHFEPRPRLAGRTAVGVNGDQTLRVVSLAPLPKDMRFVDEMGSAGQFRLEIDTAGAPQSYMLHLLEARDTKAPDMAAQIKETEKTFEVTLAHPSRGSARVVFEKGVRSRGGALGVAPGKEPPAQLAPLGEGVGSIRLEESGPKWM